ncbi:MULTISPECIES: S1 family peptidase [unclassified Lysobacter]|uniref:S1 family peptidase n=1 Tax=unclassified Lysobacter TaxID=2635362 RepID=UPI001BE7FF97|nr:MULTISPECIES: S1 family peptidase [unclassified Lysobacter]MBT2748235.1 S1 family peptidase [Lysobacter sp. ISL-42]MBT2753301.1 S1 family peptidase [Lysobacter sp. ISL-50]MBT2779026.1 S1 family peptidase [Lysobacter sp. ISL-54]MBT2784186.1 S1 family peptidase [Lysobacter sp. ISL-52]
MRHRGEQVSAAGPSIPYKKGFFMSLFQSAPRARRRSLVLALASVASLASGAVFAADSIDPRLQQAMQRDLGISARQLPQYLKTESLSLRQGASAKRALGSTFAGSWIERKADGSFKFVVASSGTGKAARSLGGAEVRTVRHSLSRLESTIAALRRLALSRVAGISKPLGGVNSWYIDPLTNSVVVSHAPGADADAVDFVASSGADAATVRFETDVGSPQTFDLVRGGIGYHWPLGEGRGVCSVGFPVTKGEVKGFATAGHCGSVARMVYIDAFPNSRTVLGVVMASDFPGTDMAWVALDDKHLPVGQVTQWANDSTVAVKGSVEAEMGAVVCRSGHVTFYKCGIIRAKNVDLTSIAGVVTGLTLTNACSGRGDSGGPVITGAGQAQGVSAGGTLPTTSTMDNCSLPVEQRRSYFQPLNPLLRKYGLKLITS